jgi:tetratricopeptide (TPR) repeat protein
VDESVYTDDYLVGTKALHAGSLAEAIAAFERVPVESPCWVMAQGNVGLALLRMSSYSKAEAQFRKVLAEIDRRGCPYPPASVQFMRNLAEAIVQQGRRAESIQEFGRACDLANVLANEHPSLEGKIQCEKAHALNSLGMAWLYLGLPGEAVEVLNQARDIYRRFAGDDRTGHAEVLTNLAVALAATEQTTPAGFALQEAIDILMETQDYDQLFRTVVVSAKVGSNLVRRDKMLELFKAGAEEALATGRPGTAYTRYCMGISFAVEKSETVDAARTMIRCARELEDRLDPLHPHVPKLRLLEAQVLRLAKESLEGITEVLIEGAHHWYKRIALPLVPADFLSETTDLHMHFRILAACLLDVGRVEDGLVAFDAGRGLGYAVEVDPDLFSRVVTQNPFSSDGRKVDLALLRQAQRTIGPDEVGVVLAVIPPRLIAFIIGGDRVGYVARVVASDQADLDALDREIRILPSRLAEGVGLRAIPQVLLKFSQEVAKEIGTRSVTRFIPYDSLHLVPWRAVLHQCGLFWHQLGFPIGFNFMLRQGDPCKRRLDEYEVIALGHGTAGAVDLEEEAKQFARAFGSHGRTILGCTADDVSKACQTNAVVLVSCHGKTVKTDDLRLVLELSGGSSLAEGVFPVRVSAPLIILSACESGVYFMAWGDYPFGAAPLLIRRGAGCVIGARFPVSASFAADFFERFARSLNKGMPINTAFASTLGAVEGNGRDLWRDLACLELLS